MLDELTIRKFGGIESCDISFSPGLNVIVGETGAGKSLLLGAVEFLKGKKLNFQSEGTAVEAVFSVDGEEVFVRREIRDGRSRFFLNGIRVPQSVIAEKLSFISYQSQHSSLLVLKPSKQIEILDSFAGVESLLEEYFNVYSSYKELLSKLDKMKKELSERERLIDILRFQVEEIESVNPEEGEEEELLRLMDIISKSEKIKLFKEFSLSELYGEGGALAKIGNVISELENLDVDSDLVETLNDIYYRLEDVVRQIEEKFRITEEEFNLEELEDRLFKIRKIKNKYGPTLEDVKAFYEETKRRLEVLENMDFEIEKLQSEFERVKDKLEKASKRLSKERKKAALEFESRIRENLKDLGLKSAVFKVVVSQTDNFSRKGRDRVEFLFTGNPSLEPVPIANSISGGELSRLLLSILSESGKDKSVMVFDEIDSGMSGKILSKVAEKLKRISENLQVIAVTHSPQVASLGDKVLKVKKEDEGTVSVKEIEGDELKKEIAIMISGEITDGSLSAADELLRRKEEI